MASGAWWTKTWSPVIGCTPVSRGCERCWAAAQVHRGMHAAHRGLTHYTGHWTGEIRCLPGRLEVPLHWRSPQRIFTGGLTDLFHPDVPGDFLSLIWQTMARCPQHTFIIPTKRPETAYDILRNWIELPNVWLLASAEDQKSLEARASWLLRTPAAVRGVSLEPLLGPVDMRPYLATTDDDEFEIWQRSEREPVTPRDRAEMYPKLDLVIVGGESGARARRCHLDWIRSVRDQCVLAHVALFVKQAGAHVIASYYDEWYGEAYELDDRSWPDPIGWDIERDDRSWPDPIGWDIERDGQPPPDSKVRVRLGDRKGADLAQLPPDLRIRQLPACRS